MTESQPSSLPPPVTPLSSQVKRRLRLRSLFGTALPYLLAFLVLAVVGVFYLPGPLTEDKTVVIPHGAGVRDVAALLDSNNAIYSPLLFAGATRLVAGNILKAGEYRCSAGQSMANILSMIHEGRSVTHLFTVAEGLTTAEVVRLLAAVPILTGDVAVVPPDGSLLPESYRYMYGDTRASVVARMQKAMQETLADLWAKRDTNIPVTTPEQALVMASVVEKETGKAVERPRIAGVFYNRIHHSMRLQSDPTVIYGIMVANGTMDHPIEHEDLSFDSPYNTYLNDGLPPKPICNPGRAALEAAMHPEWNEFLYFVADGSGGHAFAKTLAEHNQNVTKWNELQAKKP